MNPFDLRGPEFLLFYACLSAVVIAALVWYRKTNEDGDAPRLDASDPYLIAFLRGGKNETARVAVLSLIQRRLLEVVNETRLRATQDSRREMVSNPVERSVLGYFSSASEAAEIFKSGAIEAACQGYQERLERLGLLPDAEAKSRRWVAAAWASGTLLTVAMIKSTVGLARHRPIAFLVILGILSIIGVLIAAHPRLTGRGRAVVRDLQSLMGGLKDRSFMFNAHAAELPLLAAVFGLGAVPAAAFPYREKLFPQATSGSSGCGSSCGSSCGGGGCGGGGCGGCGGD